MKTVARIFLVFYMMTLTGCGVMSGDITTLMSPPKLTVEQQAVEKALSSALNGNGYELKNPSEGDYRSSFILHNLDSDPENEAVAFYCPTSEKAGTPVMILKKISGKWQKINDISGDGNEVGRIGFGDFDGDGSDDIAIGWTRFTGTNLGLGVYSSGNNKFNKVNSSFNEMKIFDMDGDGKKDIFLISLDTVAKSAKASLISYKNGQLSEVSTTDLDSTVSRYGGIYTAKADNNNIVLIDGYKGAHLMITELIEWKNGALTSPFYDKTQNIVTATLRDYPVSCTDIDSDGVVEVPLTQELLGYSSISDTDYADKMWLVSWNSISNDALNPKFSCVMNNRYNYYFVYPDKWGQNITVDKSLGDSIWQFKVWDPVNKKMGADLFDIYAYTTNQWNNQQINNPDNVIEIQEHNGMVYALQISGKTPETESYYLEISEIRQYFRTLS